MFDTDKKPWCERPPFGEFPPHKPAYTPIEDAQRTAQEMRNTIDRLLKFEQRLKADVDGLMKHLTSDNVLFKETYSESYKLFIEQVKTEVNGFESNVDNAWKLFESTIVGDYNKLSADTAKQIEDNYNSFIEKLNTFIEGINSTITEFKENINRKHGEHLTVCEEKFNMFETEVNNNIATAKNELNAEYTKCKNAIDSAVLYMKTNLYTHIETKLEEMRANGEFAELIEGAVFTDFENRLSKLESVHVESFGAVGDGTTDDTTAINTALQVAKRVIFDGKTYAISDTLKVGSNTIIEIRNATIKSTATANKKYIFDITGMENVSIIGTNAKLTMSKPTTAQQACVYIANAENVLVSGLTLSNAGGDGVIVGGTENVNSKDIKIFNCTIDGNRRNGISVIGGVNGVYITDNLIKNTGGTSPELGIDIETWQSDLYNRNITVSNNRFENNTNGDITVFEYTNGVRITDNITTGSVNVKVNAQYNDIVEACPTNIFVCGNTLKSLYFYGVPYAQYTVIDNVFDGGRITIESPYALSTNSKKNVPAKLIKGNTFNNSGLVLYAWYVANLKVCENIINDCNGFISLGNITDSEFTNNRIMGYNVNGTSNIIEMNGTCDNVEISKNIFTPSAKSSAVPKIVNVVGGSVTNTFIIDNDFSDVECTAYITYGNPNNNLDANTYMGIHRYTSNVPVASARFSGYTISNGAEPATVTLMCVMNSQSEWEWIACT